MILRSYIYIVTMCMYTVIVYIYIYTVDREIFVLKIFRV